MHLRAKEAFRQKLAEIKAEEQQRREQILEKANIPDDKREDARIVQKPDGTTHIYYGGLGDGDGTGHGHVLIDQFDCVTYHRRPLNLDNKHSFSLVNVGITNTKLHHWQDNNQIICRDK